MRTPCAIVEALLEQSGRASAVLENEFDLEAEFDQLPSVRRVARWPFAQSELNHPEDAHKKDWRFAVYVDIDGYYQPPLIGVRRDLFVRPEDRKYELDFDRLVVARRPFDFDALVATDEPIVWRDVYVKNGRFAGFVQPEETE